MARAQRLFQSQLITVERLDHASDVPPGGQWDDQSDRHSINFVERGSFSITVGQQRWTVGQSEILVTVPGMAYRSRERVASDGARHGLCLDVSFSERARDAVEGMRVEALRSHTPVVAVNNRRAYLQQRLSAHLGAGQDPLALDLVAGELLHSTLADAACCRRRYKASRLRWYGHRVDQARQQLDEQYASDHSLAGLARTAGMSSYHFARIFRELSGVPPHRYLVRRRLNAAAERLRDGASVTDTCYAVGFGSLSHFVHAFCAAKGMTPSRFRSNPSGGPAPSFCRESTAS
jgi:AraC family transcriptional regulator